MRIRFWPKKPIRGTVPQTNSLWNFLDDFKSVLFCFHTFGVRRTIDVLDSENQSGSGKIRSGALGLTGDVRLQKYENEKGRL